jgi:hypothetical protein
MEIRDLIDEVLPEPLLDVRERRDLYRLVMALESEDMNVAHHGAIAALYRNAVGPVGPVPECDIHDLRAVLAQLEEVASGVDGIPPLLRFIEGLAANVRESASGGLRKWVDQFTENHGLDIAPVLRIRHQAIRTVPAIESTQSIAYLVIEFRPDAVDSDHFLISAWLQSGGAPGTTLRRDDHPVPLSQLPHLVTALLMENPHVINRDTPELTIEFILPRRLLGTPIDQLRITVDGLERRLGIEHPVVVRSLDRMSRQALHHNWRRKWHWLRKNPNAATVCWITQPGQISSEHLYNTLLSEHSSVCLALSFPPQVTKEKLADELWVGLQAGTPIVVWCRDARDPERFAREFQQLIDAGVLSLPHSLLVLRRQAVQEQGSGPITDHLGLHMTLVFDDADRLPEPYVRLNPPA